MAGNEDNTARVKKIIEDWVAAVRRRDINGILKHHASDIVMFDVPPPFQSLGLAEYQKTWELFFNCAGDPSAFSIQHVKVVAGDDVAFAVATMRCAGTKGSPGLLDFRLTVGLEKTKGEWTIVHEHHSVPAE
jgi:ketosteroid isomerase-like protein